MSARSNSKVAAQVLADEDATLLDVVDNVLTKGVVLTGDLTIALAHVDLLYARLSLLLCAADRILPGEHRDAVQRLQDRRALKRRRGVLAKPLRAGGPSRRRRDA